MIRTKRFSKNDEGFTCAACGFQVEPLGYSSRDHCPKCLASVHVDILPGDRQNPCGGILRAKAVIPDAKKGFIIEYLCDKCHRSHRCRAALKGDQPDDMEVLISLTVAQ